MTAEDEAQNFIHATFPRTHKPGQRPTRPMVKYTQDALYSNAVVIPCTYDNHDLGHLGLVATNSEYELLIPNAAPHVPPFQPLAAPSILPNVSTQGQITESH